MFIYLDIRLKIRWIYSGYLFYYLFYLRPATLDPDKRVLLWILRIFKKTFLQNTFGGWFCISMKLVLMWPFSLHIFHLDFLSVTSPSTFQNNYIHEHKAYFFIWDSLDTRLNSHYKAWSLFFEKFGVLCFLQTPVLRFPFCLITDKLQVSAVSYLFLQLIKYIQVAARSTSPDSSIPCKVVL